MLWVKEGAGGFPVDPMHQFELHRLFDIRALGGLDLSFTNSSLWMVIAACIVGGLVFFAGRAGATVPGRLQSLAEVLYEFTARMVRENAGEAGMRYFPLVFTLFTFILACNMLGMLPYAFTVTSHIVVTFTLAAAIFLGVTLLGFIRHGVGFFSFFVPKGVPVVLLPLLVLIEVISYFTRPVSLSVRLFANMMAGHTMLKVFSGFVIMLGVWGGFVPLAFMSAFSALELLIAFLQAYVFAVLVCIYLNDALHMQH